MEEFRTLAGKGNVVPVYAQLAADFETPLSAYLKIRDGQYAFLLESAESTDASGRWSIVGSGPQRVFEARGNEVRIRRGSKEEVIEIEGDLLQELEKLMSLYKPVTHGDAPPFFGGAVGYLGYDAVRQFEPTIGDPPADDLGLPEAVFMITDTVLLFDHKLRRLLVVANAMLGDYDSPDEAYQEAVGRVASLIEILDRPLHVPALNGLRKSVTPEPVSNTTQEQYEGMVLKAKDYIAAGDIFQVVPSQRFEAPFEAAPIDLYRALRHVNPSPYMFILEMGEFSLVGSSPEVHVRCVEGRIDIRPIAGTRWRGKTRRRTMPWQLISWLTKRNGLSTSCWWTLPGTMWAGSLPMPRWR